MRPLAGFVVSVSKGVVRVKLETGNTISIKLKPDYPKFTYMDSVRVSYDFKSKKVRNIELVNQPAEGTQVCQSCSETSLNLAEDYVGDIMPCCVKTQVESED